MTKFGFVALIGEPNVGKSTLTNQLVGRKVAIVTSKVQTTRQKMLGVVLEGESQVVLIDTPGIHGANRRLEKSMVHEAWKARKEADILILMVDAKNPRQEETHAIAEKLAETPFILVINKIDTLPREKLLEITANFQKYSTIQKTFMISALTGDGVADLRTYLADSVPEGPWMYPEDFATDVPLRLWAAEITREEVIKQLHHELPYETYVETEKWEEFENGSVKISQVIFVNRKAQKSIVLGKAGQRIKEISQRARTQLSEELERPVHLFLFVKVSEDWREKRSFYRDFGLDFEV